MALNADDQHGLELTWWSVRESEWQSNPSLRAHGYNIQHFLSLCKRRKYESNAQIFRRSGKYFCIITMFGEHMFLDHAEPEARQFQSRGSKSEVGALEDAASIAYPLMNEQSICERNGRLPSLYNPSGQGCRVSRTGSSASGSSSSGDDGTTPRATVICGCGRTAQQGRGGTCTSCGSQIFLK